MNTKTDTKNIAAAGVAGAVIGAGVVAVAAVLSNKKNREALMHTASEVKDTVTDAMKKTGQKVEEAKDALKTTAKKG